MLVRLRQDNGELLAAGPRDEVHSAPCLVEQVRHLAKGLVSAGESEALVDALEAVQVEDDEAHRAPVGLGAIDLALQHLMQGDAVRHPGQWVSTSGIREPPEEPLHPASQVSQQRRGRDQRSHRDHDVMDHDVRATRRVDRGDGDDHPVVRESPDHIEGRILVRDGEVEDVQPDPHIEEGVSTGGVAAEMNREGGHQRRQRRSKPEEPERNAPRRPEHPGGPDQCQGVDRKDGGHVEILRMRQQHADC